MGDFHAEVGSSIGSVARDLRTGKLAVPEIQRGFVWNRTQVRDLLDSIYRGYPIGTMLFWESDGGTSKSPDINEPKFVLDGQQRLTAIGKVLLDNDPDIRFNLETEEFAIATKSILTDPNWISVHEVLNTDTLLFAQEKGITTRSDTAVISPRLSRLAAIKDSDVTIQVLRDYEYEEVTDIFIRANSTGTRLSGADLAIAAIALKLPGMVQEEITQFSKSLADEGWHIDTRFIVRCLVAIVTGQSVFEVLRTKLQDPEEAEKLKVNWERTKEAIESFLSSASSELGMESWDWVAANNAIVVPVAYIARTTKRKRDYRSALRWFLLSLFWQRYGGAAETRMNQDLADLDKEDPFGALEQRLAREHGRIEIAPADIAATGRRRFLLLAYLAGRRKNARDWFENIPLRTTNLGTDRSLEQHHIFPQKLVRGKFTDAEVDEIANIAFLSRSANRQIQKTPPKKYLTDIPTERLNQQVVPLDESLWPIEAFPEFLLARRALLAEEMNAVLNELKAPVS